VAEMTRFGMGPADFAEVAALMAASIAGRTGTADAVQQVRSGFTDLGFCFKGAEFEPLVQRLHELI